MGRVRRATTRLRFKYQGGTNSSRRNGVIAHPRGAIVWGPGPFRDGDGSRPWLVLNDGSHPFHGEEYLCVPLTRTERSVAVQIGPTDWVRGGSPGASFANAWAPMTRKSSELSNRQGVVRTALVDRIAAELARYAGWTA